MQNRLSALAAGIVTLVLAVVGFNRYWPAGELVDHGCGSDPPGPSALVAVDAQTGDLLWSRRSGHPLGIGHGDGAVVVGGVGGILRGFDGSSGAALWCNETAPAPGIQSKFAAADEIVATYSPDGEVIAIDPSTGREKWRFPISQPDSESDTPGPTVRFDAAVQLLGGDVLWVTNGAAKTSLLAAIDPTTGKILDPLPSFPTSQFPGNSVSQLDGLRLSSASAGDYNRQELQLRMTDAVHDTELWSRLVPGFLVTLTSTESGEAMVVVIDQTAGTATSLNDDTYLSAYAGSDGSLLWQQTVPRTTSGVFRGEPGTFLVSDGEQFSARSVATGKTQWVANHGNPGRQRPYTSEGWYADIVYMPDYDTYVGLVISSRPYRD